MKKLVTFIIVVASTFACRDNEEGPLTQNPDDVLEIPLGGNSQPIITELATSAEVTEVIEFNDKYILAGYDGFIITDRNLNKLNAYEEDMILGKLLNYKNEFVCVCTNQGIYSVDNSSNIKKIIDQPCSDMEIDSDNKIIFVSSEGELSQERQISANVLVLDVDNQSFDFYTDPGDSIGTFLGQIEALSNGDIFTLGTNASVYHYKDKELVARYSKETIDFFPENKSGLGTGYELLAMQNELYFISPQFPKRLLTFQQLWQAIFDVDGDQLESDSGKDREIFRSSINGLNSFKDDVLVATQNGIVKVDPVTQEYHFIKDPNFPNQFVRSVYSSINSDELIIVLAGNNIIKYEM